VRALHPRQDKRGVDLISDALPFGRLWYGEPDAHVIFEEWSKNEAPAASKMTRTTLGRTHTLILAVTVTVYSQCRTAV
jgi:hypothetical protein